MAATDSEPTTARAPARTASKQVRRRQLIEATISSIARNGISGTTMTTVTEAAGLSMGIVNFHFRSKQNLFEETLEFLAHEHQDVWKRGMAEAGDDAEGQLLAIVDAHFDAKICSPRKLAVWFAFYGEAGNRAAYRARLDPIDDDRLKTTAALCERIRDAGGYADVDPRQVSLSLEAMFDGLCLNILMYPGTFSRKLARRQIRQFLRSVFPRHFATED